MRRRIILALASIFLLFSFGVGVSIYDLYTTATELRHLIGLHEIADVRQALNLSALRVQSYVYAHSSKFAANIDEIIKNTLQMDSAIKRCSGCHHTPAVQAEFQYLEKLSREFQEKLSFLVTTVSEDEWRMENQRNATTLASTIIHQVQDMVDRAAMTIQRKTSQVMEHINQTYILLFLTLGVTFVSAFLIAQYLTKGITGPISALAEAASHISQGQLGYKIDYKASAEFGKLIRTFNAMSSSLQEKDNENSTLCKNLEFKMEELRKTQRHLIEAEKITAVGTLAGGIAHDFNNILCGIISNIALLKRLHHTDKEEYQLLEVIEKAGFRAANLVQQLLAFSRKDKWTPQAVNLNENVCQVVSLVKNALPESITIRVELEDPLPTVMGDPARMEQIIMNLCINARDAMEQGGEILLKTTTRQFDEEETKAASLEATPGKYVGLMVTDTGSGIAPEVLPRIFDPFFTTKPVGQGTGLGLAMVHGIVKNHKGFCTVESEVGHGTTFTIYLPVVGAQNA